MGGMGRRRVKEIPSWRDVTGRGRGEHGASKDDFRLEAWVKDICTVSATQWTFDKSVSSGHCCDDCFVYHYY